MLDQCKNVILKNQPHTFHYLLLQSMKHIQFVAFTRFFIKMAAAVTKFADAKNFN